MLSLLSGALVLFHQGSIMHHSACGFFSYDDPPAPQEPPQLHTPLSPPRSRMNSAHPPSSSSGSNKATTRNSVPAQSTAPRPHTPKTRTRSADETHRSTTRGSASVLSPTTKTVESCLNPGRSVTKDKSRITALTFLGPADNCVSEAHTKNATSAPSRIAETDPTLQVGAHKDIRASRLDGIQGKTSRAAKSSSSKRTTTMQLTGPSPVISAHRDMASIQDTGRESMSMVDRRDSVDTDGRSMISSFLDAYCRSDTGEDADFFWEDNASIVFSDETVALEYLADSPDGAFSGRPGSSSTIVVPDLPPKRPKPTSLVITSSPRWEDDLRSPHLPAPQTAPATKSGRPLPRLPSCQRPLRPLPRPPQPPPYTSPTDPIFSDMPSISSLSTPSGSSASSASSSPSSSGSTSFTSVSSSSSTPAKTNVDKLSNQPNISKRPFLAPLLTIPTSSSGGLPSPVTPDIPVPPSPMTAKRHQASKLSKMLGEEITPELLCGRRVGAPLPPLPSRPPVINTQSINQHLNSIPDKVTNNHCAPTPRDAQLPSTRLRTRAVRPQAIYVHDNISEDLNHDDNGDNADDDEKVSLFDFADNEGHNRHTGIRVDIAVGEEIEDQTSLSLSPASSRKTCSVGTSPSDSLLEEIDDMEEAHIGWALQNVITYQMASRVKRTSRMWVLEKNGQRWEEQDYNNVRQALRQL